MDFASRLANLEQTASNASQNNDNNNRRRGRSSYDNNNYYNNNEDRRRYQPRPRHNNNNNSNYGGRGGSGRGGYYDRNLDALLRFGYRIPRGPYRRSPPVALSEIMSGQRPLHICLLAITIDDLPYEHIWKEWANANTTNTATNLNIIVSLVAHAKYPNQVQSTWLQQRLILQPRHVTRGNSLSEPEFLSYKPKWGSIEIARAMIETLVNGMKIGKKEDKDDNNDPRFSPQRFVISTTKEIMDDKQLSTKDDIPPVDKFIFISETCLPVTTLEECIRALFDIPASASADVSQEEKTPSPSQEQHKEEDEQIEATKEEQPNEQQQDQGKQKEQEGSIQQKDNNNTNDKEDKKKDDEIMIYLDTSWVNARNFNSPNTPQNKYERDQFSKIHRMIPNRFRWKADQWLTLSRPHAAAILDLDRTDFATNSKDQLWNSFRNINASDEMYFPTTLSLAGILHDPINLHNMHHQGSTYYPNQQQQQQQDQGNNNDVTRGNSNKDEKAAQQQFERQEHAPWLQRRPVTYTDWSMGMRNPASFIQGMKDFKQVARLARKKGCLFARKFALYLEEPGNPTAAKKTNNDLTGEIKTDEWQAEIQSIMEEEQAAAIAASTT